MSKHTPGPWLVCTPDNSDLYLSIEFVCENFSGNDGFLVGDVSEIATINLAEPIISKEERIANAHLIAAAPELLAVLIDVREAWLDERLGDVEGILTGDVCANAIAKATGEDK